MQYDKHFTIVYFCLVHSALQLDADKQHYYSGEDVLPHGPVTYVRVTMSPDGGISRLRLNGRRNFDRFQTWTHAINAVTQDLHKPVPVTQDLR